MYIEKIPTKKSEQLNKPWLKKIFRPMILASAVLALQPQAKAVELPEIKAAQKYHLELAEYDGGDQDVYYAGNIKDYFDSEKIVAPGYEVYMPGIREQQEFTPYAQSFYQGIATAEWDFGEMNIVDKVIFYDSKGGWGAYFKYDKKNNSYNINFSNKNLHDTVNSLYSEERKNFDFRCTAYHEAVHAIDERANIVNNDSEEGKKFIDYFSKIEPTQFLDRLAEGSFMLGERVSEKAGHPWGNPKELFATFITTLSHPLLLDKLMKQSASFQKEYLELARQVQLLLVSNEFKDTHIDQRLSSVIEFLEKKCGS